MGAASVIGAVRSSGRSWLQERKRLYHEWERISEVTAQARILVEELRRRRDGMPARIYDLWAIREALAEVDAKAPAASATTADAPSRSTATST